MYFYSSGDPREFGKQRKAWDTCTVHIYIYIYIYIYIMVTHNTSKQEDVQLAAVSLTSFCKLNTFRKRVRNVVNRQGNVVTGKGM